MTTDSPWWKNLRGEDGAGAPVTLRVEGRDYPGLAEAVTDEEVARVLEMVLRAYPSYGRFVGMKSGERMDRTRIEEVARERVVIRARLGKTIQKAEHQRGE